MRAALQSMPPGPMARFPLSRRISHATSAPLAQVVCVILLTSPRTQSVPYFASTGYVADRVLWAGRALDIAGTLKARSRSLHTSSVQARLRATSAS